MKKNLLLLLLLAFSIYSVSAQISKSRGALMYPHATEFMQPDGSKIVLKGNGDAVVNWLSTEKGYTVLQTIDGWYEYAVSKNSTLKSSGIRVSSNQKTTNEDAFFSTYKPGLKYNKQYIDEREKAYFANDSKSAAKGFPTTGNQNVLLILAYFSDMSNDITSATFDNVMNQENYNSTGSFRDFYLASSYNQLDLTTTVTAWVAVPNTHAYYGANDGDGYDVRPREFVRAAVDAAEAAGIDFSQFDNDNDGYVDGIQVIHAGYGEESGGSGTDNIWSHRWSLSSQAVTYDGVTINDYAIYPELRGSSGSNPSHIGVICHEFGHTLGLPDFYDTDYTGSGGQAFDLGKWDMMAGGSWNNSGAKPANHNAYSKSEMGWLTLTELNSPQIVTLKNGMENPEAYKISTGTGNEFFVVENRQQIKFDTYVPHHGMIVFHVDLNYSGWSSNDINCDPDHQGMDIEEADGSQSSGSYSGDPFPGTSNKTEFTDETSPSMNAWNNSSTGKPITDIDETNSIISFNFMGAGGVDKPGNFEANSTTQDEISLSWSQDSQNHHVLLAYSNSNTFGTPVNGTSYTAGQTISGGGDVVLAGDFELFTHTLLAENTTYYYQIWSTNDTIYSAPA